MMLYRSCVIVVLLALCFLTGCGANSAGEIDENIGVGTHSLHIRCVGKGNPIVVIDTGLGDTLERWKDFQTRAAEITRVCLYDRAGYGSSEAGPMPRTSQRAAEELKRLLDNSGIEGPYVFVGHSLGGINLQVFADQYPDLVAGLILLDPPPLPFITGKVFPSLYQMYEQQASEFQNLAEAARESTDENAQEKVNYLEAVASEQAALITESASQVASIQSFGDIPLMVIASGKPNPAFGADAEAFQRFWIEQNQELSKKSSYGTFVLAEESSHSLHEDAPDVVLDAIRKMME